MNKISYNIEKFAEIIVMSIGLYTSTSIIN